MIRKLEFTVLLLDAQNKAGTLTCRAVKQLRKALNRNSSSLEWWKLLSIPKRARYKALSLSYKKK